MASMRANEQAKLLPVIEHDPHYVAPMGHKHTWVAGEFVWSSKPWCETNARMVFFCRTCPEIRGRVGDA